MEGLVWSVEGGGQRVEGGGRRAEGGGRRAEPWRAELGAAGSGGAASPRRSPPEATVSHAPLTHFNGTPKEMWCAKARKDFNNEKNVSFNRRNVSLLFSFHSLRPAQRWASPSEPPTARSEPLTDSVTRISMRRGGGTRAVQDQVQVQIQVQVQVQIQGGSARQIQQ